MLKIAFVTLVCGVYADTVYVLCAVLVALLGAEQEAVAEPVYSVALQLLLSLTVASLLRREQYKERGQWWTFSSLISNSDLPMSFERSIAVPFIYVGSLLYNRTIEGKNDVPVGPFVTQLIVGLLLWVFDVILHMRKAHELHVRRHEDDTANTAKLGTHTHAMTTRKFHSMPTIIVAAAFVVWPDLIVQSSSVWLWAFPPVAAVVQFLVSNLIGWQLSGY